MAGNGSKQHTVKPVALAFRNKPTVNDSTIIIESMRTSSRRTGGLSRRDLQCIQQNEQSHRDDDCLINTREESVAEISARTTLNFLRTFQSGHITLFRNFVSQYFFL